MSAKKNKNVLDDIFKTNYLGLNRSGIVSAMLKQEVAGQRVFYVFLRDKLKPLGFEIKPETMDKNQSDGIVGNAIIECKLDEKEGGGPKKAYQELYEIIPNRLKSKGERLPFYRIYVELETFLVEVYDCHCKLVDTFDWFEKPENFLQYFNNTKDTYEYDLLDESVDLVEVIQNIYHCFDIKEKIDAYNKLKEGIVGWFKPFDYEKADINRLILNNDKMNEKYVQKVQGAFFTPAQYVKISTQYVMNAIEQCKEYYDDYVIIDRCAGVGNLESQFENEIYPHLILGTLNEAEALTANIRFNGLASVLVVDAMTEDGVKHYQKEIEKYKIKHNVEKLAVIFLENPPYRNSSGNIHEERETNETGNDFVWSEMTKEKNVFRNKNISSVRDICNRFIWSAYKYFDVSHYILYSPVGFWKSVGLIDKEFYSGYICNRKYFNASEAAILLSHWGSKDTVNSKLICGSELGNIEIFPISSTVSEYTKSYTKHKNNPFGYIYSTQGTPDFKHGGFVSAKDYKSSTRGIFSVTKDDILYQCPLFVANCYEPKNYTEKENIMKSSDKSVLYQSDNKFLQNCLLYSLCTSKNHCESDCGFYELAESKLSSSLKNSDIYLLYKELSVSTNVNGL